MAYENGNQKKDHQNVRFRLDKDKSTAYAYVHQNSNEQMSIVRRLIHVVRKFPQLYENVAMASGGNGQVQDGEQMDEIWAKVKEMVDPKNPNVNTEPDQKGLLQNKKKL
jgi:hypothetical protein